MIQSTWKHSWNYHNFSTLPDSLEKAQSQAISPVNPSPTEGEVFVPADASSLLTDTYSVIYSFHFETGLYLFLLTHFIASGKSLRR